MERSEATRLTLAGGISVEARNVSPTKYVTHLQRWRTLAGYLEAAMKSTPTSDQQLYQSIAGLWARAECKVQALERARTVEHQAAMDWLATTATGPVP